MCPTSLFSTANEWSVLHGDDNEENISTPLCSTPENQLWHSKLIILPTTLGTFQINIISTKRMGYWALIFFLI